MVITIGESVYDIIFKGGQPVSSVFGGSMYNVAVSLGRINADVIFAGFYANDRIGNDSNTFLVENNVNTNYFKCVNDAKSNIALAFLDEQGIPDYDFYRDPKLAGRTVEIDFSIVDVFLVGSFFAINDLNFEMILNSIQKARQSNAIVVYDPNIRNRDIHKTPKLLDRVKIIMQNSDFVKMSDEDILHLTGENDENKWHEFVKNLYVTKYVITRGEKSAIAIYEDKRNELIVPKTSIVSTVGAGDATTAGILSCGVTFLSNHNQFLEAVKKGIQFGSHVCTLSENFISKDFNLI